MSRAYPIWYLNITLVVMLGVSVLAGLNVLSDLEAVGAITVIFAVSQWLIWVRLPTMARRQANDGDAPGGR